MIVVKYEIANMFSHEYPCMIYEQAAPGIFVLKYCVCEFMKRVANYMYPEFAYTREMQIILAVVAVTTNYMIVYRISSLILLVYGEKAGIRQKSVFAFFIGTLLNTAWSYAIYFIGGRQSFSPIVYSLVVTTNPFFAMLYYLMGIKILKLSPIRSIKLMGHVYLYYMLIKSLSGLLASAFFVQPPGRYNYLLDVFKNLAIFAVFLIAIFITGFVLQHNKQAIKLRDSTFINLKKELIIYFIKATVIYLSLVCIPRLFSDKVVINSVIFLILGFIFSLSILWDMYLSVKNDAENRNAHINFLLKGTLIGCPSDLSELKRRINENPSLISVLIDKHNYAEKMKVRMSMLLYDRLDDFFIDNIDVCIVVSCLLDNAIEAAANSDQKKVSFAIDPKADGEKLIIVNNSSAIPVDTDKIIFHGITTKEGHQGKGLNDIRTVTSKYGNCTFRLSYYNYEVSAYFEIKRNDLNQLPLADSGE